MNYFDIRTRIVRVEIKHADLTYTTAITALSIS